MELSWSTFALEIFNFLILVWLLVRFLYRPVMNIIDRRRQEISNQLSAADAVRNEAESLKLDYQEQINAWEHEKSTAVKILQNEIADERKIMLADLRLELEREREKAGILNKRQMEDVKTHMQRQARQHGAVFCSRLLTRMAGPELESAIIDLVIEDLEQLTPEQREQLKKNHGTSNNGITVYSVFPVTEKKKSMLEQKLTLCTAPGIHCNYKLDPELIAGLSIKVGAWRLQANLRDELKFFTDFEHQNEPERP